MKIIEENKTEKLLLDRGAMYGNFVRQANLENELLEAIYNSKNWFDLPKYQKTAIRMIIHKLSRQLNGNFMYDDNFKDIIGYSQLALDEIERSMNEKF